MTKFKSAIRSSKYRQAKPQKNISKKRFLIVTEGKVSEIQYFNSIIREFGINTTDVIVTPSKGTAPINVVQKVEEIVKESTDGELAEVFCVFDRDKHDSYCQALQRIEKLSKLYRKKCDSIQAIPSIPCFEYWYLLHVQYSRQSYSSSPSPCKDLIKVLKEKPPFKTYAKKNKANFYTQLADLRENAIKNAKQVIVDATDVDETQYCEDPSTRVYLIIEALQKMAQSTLNA